MRRPHDRTIQRERIQRMATTALLGSLALLLSYIETMIPLPFAVPGIKLGLANVAVLVALFALDVRSAAAVALIKVLASGFLFGTPTMLAYSAGGTVLALAAMVLCQRVFKLGPVPVSMASAICHNAGQLAVAALMLGSGAVFLTLPPLAVAACVTGALIGGVAGGVIDALQVEECDRRHVDLSGLELVPGEHVAFVGANGSGKTTAALQLAGLAEGASGGARLVFQDPDDQLVSLIAQDDVAFGCENLGIELAEMRRLVAGALADAGASDLALRDVTKLSGGQKQQVAIAGVLAMSPRLVVFDEATSMQDAAGRARFAALVGQLKSRGVTVVTVTQIPAEAACADRVAVFEGCKLVELISGADYAQRLASAGASPLGPGTGEHPSSPAMLSGADEVRVAGESSRAMCDAEMSPLGPVMLSGARSAESKHLAGEYTGLPILASRSHRLCHVERSETKSSEVETSICEYAGVQVSVSQPELQLDSSAPATTAPFAQNDVTSEHTGVRAPAGQLELQSDSSVPGARPAPCAQDDGVYERTSESMRALRLEGVSYCYPGVDRPVLEGVNLTVAPGCIVGLSGPSGSGKSTVAQIAAGYLVPNVGTVTLDDGRAATLNEPTGQLRKRRILSGPAVASVSDREVANAFATSKQRRQARRVFRTHVALVSQSPERALFATTAFEDVMFGARNRGFDEQKAAAAAEEALRCVGIDPQAACQKGPFAYSGGEKRRIALAGMLVLDTPYLVLDEPDAGLDPRELARLEALLASLRAQGKGVLLISHNEAFLEACCDERLILCGPDAVMSGVMKPDEAATDIPVATKPREVGRWETACEVAKKSQCFDRGFCGSDLDAVRDNESHLPTLRRFATEGPVEAPGFGVYQPGSTFMHRLNPLAKLVGCVLFMVAGFLASSWMALGLAALFCALALAAARTTARQAFAALRPFAFLMVFVGVFDVFFAGSGDIWWQAGPVSLSSGGVVFATQSVLRFALVALGTSTLMRTTSATQLADACSLLLAPLSKLGLHPDNLALSLGMTLRFIPLVQQEFAAVKCAQEARLASFDAPGIAARLKSYIPVFTPLFANCLRRSAALALAIENRAYGCGVRRTRFRGYPLHAIDVAALILAAALLAAAIAL